MTPKDWKYIVQHYRNYRKIKLLLMLVLERASSAFLQPRQGLQRYMQLRSLEYIQSARKKSTRKDYKKLLK